MRCSRIAVYLALLIAATFIEGTSGEAFAGFLPGLYATATNNDEIIRINSDGTFQPVLTGVPSPYGLAFRDDNTLYVTERTSISSNGGQLVGYQPNGTKVFSAGPIPASNGFPNGSWGFGLAIDSQGTSYIATHNSPGATKVTSDGTVSDWTGYQYDMWWGKDAVFSPSGNLYMTSALAPGDESFIQEVDKTTGAVTTVLSGLYYSGGIAFDSAGNMYLSQWGLNRIVEVPAGTTNIVPVAAVNDPFLMTFGPDGNLYVIGGIVPGYVSGTQIWEVDVHNGATTLVADGLPAINDIAFAPEITSVPAPSCVVLLATGLLGLFCGRWFLKPIRCRR